MFGRLPSGDGAIDLDYGQGAHLDEVQGEYLLASSV